MPLYTEPRIWFLRIAKKFSTKTFSYYYVYYLCKINILNQEQIYHEKLYGNKYKRKQHENLAKDIL